ncbi:MAG: hypothetical protein HQL41_05660 [Alphaproteobacteria bacterium]|nr:hypothetical protein [Alphaproteobacteria bacterium]
MADNGRLVVPARVTDDGALVLEPFDAAVARMRRTVGARMGDERTHVVDEFLAERRADAEAEGHD